MIERTRNETNGRKRQKSRNLFQRLLATRKKLNLNSKDILETKFIVKSLSVMNNLPFVSRFLHEEILNNA